METSLSKGDRVFVNKSAYGIRLPMTPVAIPFAFNTFLGIKSYSELIQFGYHRLGTKIAERNDIVLFNNPTETDKPLDRRSLSLSRCIGMPGDTMQMGGEHLLINSKKFLPPPDLMTDFRFNKEKEDSILTMLSRFEIPARNMYSDSTGGYLSLNRYEAYLLEKELPHSLKLEARESGTGAHYTLLVPAKGSEITLSPFNVRIYASIIAYEAEKTDEVTIENMRLLKNGAPLKSYTFKENYYWLISDNPSEAIDSRKLGFISERFIIGKVTFIWFSSDADGIRWKRMFKQIE
jgi:signal peptidase I